MIRKAFKILLPLLMALVAFSHPAVSGGSVKVRADIDVSETVVGDDVVYTVAVEGENMPDNIQPEVAGLQADGLTVLGVRTSSSMSSGSSFTVVINGQVVRDDKSGSETRNFEYHIRANKQGNYKIGPAVVRLGGAAYSSNALTLKISSEPSPGTSVVPTGKVFLKAEPSASKVWLGQPFTVTYYFYAREDAGVQQLIDTELPDLNGFIKYDFAQTKMRPSKVVLNGVNYVRVYLGKFVLFPVRTGALTIGPLKQYFVQAVDMGSMFPTTGQGHAASSPVTIEVAPLPDKDKPADFSGAVGRFNIEANLDKTDVRAGENLTMTVRISGYGNLQSAADPKIVLPPTVQSYPPEKTENSSSEDNAVKWERTYRYILTPKSGPITIGPARFSYFDPEKGAYATVVSNSFNLNVASGPESVSAIEPQTQSAKIGNDVRYIKPDATRLETANPFFYRSGLYVACHFIPIMLLGGAVLLRRRRDRLETDVHFARKTKSQRRALARIEQAKKVIDSNEDEFYRELYMAISGYIADNFNMPDVGLTPVEFAVRFKETNISEDDSNKIIGFLETIQSARYLPGGGVEKKMDLISDAEEIFSLLRRVLKEASAK